MRLAKPAKPIRVFLIPSQTYEVFAHGSNLQILADRLNETQRCFRFQLVTGAVRSDTSARPVSQRRAGAAIKKSRPLICSDSRAYAPRNPAEKEAAISTYIGDFDAFEQYKQFAIAFSPGPALGGTAFWMRQYSRLFRLSACDDQHPFCDDDLVVGIGGEVVVQDIERELEGTAEADAFSCLSTLGRVEVDEDNDALGEFGQIGVVSLMRLGMIFPEVVVTDDPERARAITARYLILNIVNLVSNRVFSRTLCHEDANGCNNQTAWIGGERESYYNHGFCDECRDAYLRLGVSGRYSRFKPEILTSALESLLQIPDHLESLLKKNRKNKELFNIAVITIATGLISNLILDMTFDRIDREWHFHALHIKSHAIASVVALLAILFGIALSLNTYLYRRKLP